MICRDNDEYNTCAKKEETGEACCCRYCEYKNNCSGFCSILEEYGDTTSVAFKCEDFEI